MSAPAGEPTPTAIYECRAAYYYKGRTLILDEPFKTLEEFKAALAAEQFQRQRQGRQMYTHVAVIFAL